ncbi:MAG: hypothetical protein ACK55I_31680, partial [bacterium]
MPLAGRRGQALARDGDARGPHAGLALVRAADGALGHHQVAVVEHLRQRELALGDVRLAHRDLQVAGGSTKPE